MASYAVGRTVAMGFDEAVAAITAAIGQQGFGVLTDIDIAATMQKKLGVTMGKYRILGACNPTFAHQALTAEPAIGALLPCNVVVREEAGGATRVEFMDPESVLALVDRPEVKPLATEVKRRLAAALDSL